MEKFYPAYRVNSHFLYTDIPSVKRHYRALYAVKHLSHTYERMVHDLSIFHVIFLI